MADKITTHVNDKNFEEEVLKANIPVLVDFWAPWCGPCQMVGPVLEEIAKELNGKVKIAKMNVDENQNIPLQYNVLSIPTFIFFKDGEAVNQAVGALPREKLKSLIDEVAVT